MTEVHTLLEYITIVTFAEGLACSEAGYLPHLEIKMDKAPPADRSNDLIKRHRASQRSCGAWCAVLGGRKSVFLGV